MKNPLDTRQAALLRRLAEEGMCRTIILASAPYKPYWLLPEMEPVAGDLLLPMERRGWLAFERTGPFSGSYTLTEDGKRELEKFDATATAAPCPT